MAVRHPTEFDLDRIDALIAHEEADPRAQARGLDRLPRDRRPLTSPGASPRAGRTRRRTRSSSTTARATACGTSTATSTSTSTWATARWWWATRTRRSSRRSRSRRRCGTHFAQPTKDLDVIGENLAERFGLPLWRFCNSGTEATLEALRLMRANTGRDMIIKIEGTYHGHHDSLMFSRGARRCRDRPARAPGHRAAGDGHPAGVRGPRARRAVQRPRRRPSARSTRTRATIAGMIVEPAMMNCGVILPEPGYLQGLKDLCHANGAYLAFDEVKTGATLAYGGADRGLRRHARHHLSGQGDRRRHAVRRDRRRREELYRPVIDGEYDMAGTFNGNPLTMAASRAALTEVLTPDVYDHFNRIDKVDAGRLTSVDREVRSAGLRHRARREGLGHLLDQPVREYRDAVGIDERDHATSPGSSSRTAACSSRRGPSRRPGRCRCAHTEDDAQRYVDELRGVRGRRLAVGWSNAPAAA